MGTTTRDYLGDGDGEEALIVLVVVPKGVGRGGQRSRPTHPFLGDISINIDRNGTKTLLPFFKFNLKRRPPTSFSQSYLRLWYHSDPTVLSAESHINAGGNTPHPQNNGALAP